MNFQLRQTSMRYYLATLPFHQTCSIFGVFCTLADSIEPNLLLSRNVANSSFKKVPASIIMLSLITIITYLTKLFTPDSHGPSWRSSTSRSYAQSGSNFSQQREIIRKKSGVSDEGGSGGGRGGDMSEHPTTITVAPINLVHQPSDTETLMLRPKFLTTSIRKYGSQSCCCSLNIYKYVKQSYVRRVPQIHFVPQATDIGNIRDFVLVWAPNPDRNCTDEKLMAVTRSTYNFKPSRDYCMYQWIP